MHFFPAASTVADLAETAETTADLAETAETVADLTETAEASIDYLQKLIEFLVDKAQLLVGALIILIVGLYICKFIRKVVRNSLKKTRLDASVAGFINSLTKYGLWALLAVIVINKLGVDTTSIIALLTSASLAVGLALQGCLSNLAGGILLLIMKPFVVGDYINDGCGHEGTVTAIEIIYTRLLTADNQSICIPNGKLADSSVTNLTHQTSRRIDFEVGIDYGENIDHVRSVLLETASKSPYPDTSNPPQVFVTSFDSSSVKIVLRIWCATDNYWPAKFEIQEAIKKAFDEEGITIPYEHMDVNIIHPSDEKE